MDEASAGRDEKMAVAIQGVYVGRQFSNFDQSVDYVTTYPREKFENIHMDNEKTVTRAIINIEVQEKKTTTSKLGISVNQPLR